MTVGETRKATLNAFDIACVVVGGIIGIGIFFTPSKVAAAVDSPAQVISVWAIGGAMIIFGALTYARLSQVAPGYGGVFEYLRQAFGPLPAFLYGWCNLTIIQSGALAVVGLVMADYLQEALACRAFSPGERTGIATLGVILLTVVNAVGLRVGKGVQIVLTVLKTAAVFSIVAIAVLTDGRAPPPPPIQGGYEPEPVGFLRAMSLAILPVLFSCGGFQHGSFVSTVAKRPLRDVPIGIVTGVVVVVVAYLTLNLAFLEVLGQDAAANSKTIAADAVSTALGGGEVANTVSRVFAAVIVVSALGLMNTICMAPPYVLHAMARRQLFFRSVGNMHAKFGTPLVAMALQGAWAAALLWITQWMAWSSERFEDPLGFLLDGVVFVDWMFYGAAGVALLVILRRRAFERADRFYFVVGSIFALSALAVTIGAIFTTRWPTTAGLAVLALGFIAYGRFRQASGTRSDH